MGRRATWDVRRAYELEQAGKSHREIAEILGIEASRQAISKRLKEYKLTLDEPEAPGSWPWQVSKRHTQRPDALYKMMLAYRKWDSGKAVSKDELSMAKTLRKWADRLGGGAAITYDEDKGFMWTSRRDEDGDKMFVVR